MFDTLNSLSSSFTFFVILQSAQSLQSNDIGHVATIFDHYAYQDATNVSSVSHAVCKKTSGHVEIDCKVQITSLERDPVEDHCDLKLPNGEKLVTLKRLNANKLLLSWLQLKKKTQKMKVDVVDMRICSSVQLDFPPDSRLVTYNDSNFDVIVSDRTICKFWSNCRLTFDQDGNALSDAIWFNAYLRDMVIEPVNKNLFTRGRVQSMDRFKVFHMTASGEVTNVFNYGPTIEAVSTGQRGAYVICHLDLRVRPLILCARFNGTGVRIMNNAVALSKDVRLIGVRVLDDDEIVLFTERGKCAEEECSEIFVTKMRSDEEPETKVRLLACAGDRREMVFDAMQVNGVPMIIYGCDKALENGGKSSLEFQMEEI